MTSPASDALLVSDCRMIDEFCSPTRDGDWPLPLLLIANRCARRPGDIFVFAGPTTVQTKTRLPAGAAGRPRMVPSYLPSPPLPVGLKPQLTSRSSPSAPPNVQVRIPMFMPACCAEAAVTKDRTINPARHATVGETFMLYSFWSPPQRSRPGAVERTRRQDLRFVLVRRE